jgi:phosphohistidine phosphatase SixA
MAGFELYLVRHAIAAERGPQWPNDGKRPLTDQGISRFKEAVEGLAAACGRRVRVAAPRHWAHGQARAL